MLMIERGYELRHIHMWSASRWETYHVMAAQVGTEGLKEAGITKPSDLLRLPGDRNENDEESGGSSLTDSDIARLRRQMEEENAARERNTET